MSATNCSMSSCVTVQQIPIPPPPINFLLNSKECRYSKKMNAKQKLSANWAAGYAEIQKACVLAHVCTESKPKHYRIKQNICAVIQEGPTCGLTALTMLTGGHPSASDILILAKRKQFTNHGEMFSAINMCQLAENVFDTLNYGFATETHNGELNCDRIKYELMNGACVLVAYDSDFNHAPCLKNGHKAHWALIIGYLVDYKNTFYVFVRHGKTKNLALWSLASLSESNSNLNEYKAPQRYDEYSFQMPVDGIAGKCGLKNQCVIINGVHNMNDLVCSYD